jgi:hypothetical protein
MYTLSRIIGGWSTGNFLGEISLAWELYIEDNVCTFSRRTAYEIELEYRRSEIQLLLPGESRAQIQRIY